MSYIDAEDSTDRLNNFVNRNFSHQHQPASLINSNTSMQISANLLNEYLRKNFSNNSDNKVNLNNYYQSYYENIFNQQANLNMNSNNMLNLDTLDALKSSPSKKPSSQLQNELSNFYKLKQNEYFYLQQQSNNVSSGENSNTINLIKI